MEKFIEVGRLWNDNNFIIISNSKKFYVLNANCWNGESYSNCWEVADSKGLEKVGETIYTITPVYKEINEDEFEIVDYKIY